MGFVTEMCACLLRKDTYNPKKETYWYEEKVSASMVSSACLTTSDTTTVEADVQKDAQGNVVLGHHMNFDPMELDHSMIPSSSSGSAGNLPPKPLFFCTGSPLNNPEHSEAPYVNPIMFYKSCSTYFTEYVSIDRSISVLYFQLYILHVYRSIGPSRDIYSISSYISYLLYNYLSLFLRICIYSAIYPIVYCSKLYFML